MRRFEGGGRPSLLPTGGSKEGARPSLFKTGRPGKECGVLALLRAVASFCPPSMNPARADRGVVDWEKCQQIRDEPVSLLAERLPRSPLVRLSVLHKGRKQLKTPSQTHAVLGRRRLGTGFTSYLCMGRRLRYIPEGTSSGLAGSARRPRLGRRRSPYGHLVHRTQESAARRRGKDFDRLKYATTETLHLSPLPCWKNLPPEAWKERTLHLVHEIEEEATVRRSGTGSQPLGAAAIRGQHPHDRPKRPKRPEQGVSRGLYLSRGTFEKLTT
jgi:hypothetical protein